MKQLIKSPLLSKLGIGTVQFGLNYGISNQRGITGIREVNKILEFARGEGIDLIDTAYGYGRSEEVLGQAGVRDFKVVSKFLPESYGISIQEQVKTSMERLKIKKLYGLLAHRPLDIIGNPQIWDYLLDMKTKSVVEKIGFSFNNPEEAELVLEGGFEPDLIQAPLNYLDNRFSNIMILLKKKGCEVHSRSAFLQGLFFIPSDTLPVFFEEIKPLLNELQGKKHLGALLLNYCTQQVFIDRVVIGVNNLEQLRKNITPPDIKEKLPDLNQHISHEILTPSLWPKQE